jgi:hypothetical protein
MWLGALEVVVIRMVSAPTPEAPVGIQLDPALRRREVMPDLVASGALNQRRVIPSVHEFDLATKHTDPFQGSTLAVRVVYV